ncbi:UNVERIFIED_CONTAM: hypothetical protein FKN15_035324 [Acipenser sinensis]
MDRSQTRYCPGCWKFTLLSIVFILHLIPLCVHGGLLEGNTTLLDNKNNDSSLCLGCRSGSSSGAKAEESLSGEHKEGGPEVSTGSSWPTAREPFVWGLRGTKELGGTSTPLLRESQEELGSGDQLFKPLANTAFGAAADVGVLGESSTTAPLRQDATTTVGMSSTEISQDSAEKEHLIEVLGASIGAEPSNNRDIQSLQTPDTTEIRLDFKGDEQVMLWGGHTDSPAQGAEGSLDFTLLDLDMQLRAQPATTPTTDTLATTDILSVDYYDPFADLDLGDTPLPKTSSVLSAREVLGEPTSWTLPEVYDYFTPYDDSYPSTTEVYPDDEDEYTTSDLEDENDYRLITAPPDPWILLQDRGTLPPQPGLDPRSESIVTEDVKPSGSDEDEAGQAVTQLPSGQGSALNNNNSSECRMGYVKHNFTCKSVCDIFPSYCFNGGQCYLVENTGVFCRSGSSSGAKAEESLSGEHKEGGPEVSTGSSWPTAREPFVWGLRGTKELGGTSTPLLRESQEELGSGDQLFKPLANTAFGAAADVGVLGESSTTAPLRQDATTTVGMSSTEISQDSAEKEHLIEVLGASIGAEPSNNRDIQSLQTPDTTEIRLDFKGDEQVMLWGGHTDSPAQGAEGSLDFTLLDLDMQLRAQPATTPTTDTLATTDILSVDYYDPFADLDLGDTPLPKTSSVLSAREVLGEPTSWTLPEVYDYFTPYDDSYPSTTEVYPDDEDEYTTSDLEDENDYRLITAPPDPWILLQDRGTLPPQPGLDPRSESIVTEDVKPSGSDEDEAGQAVTQLPSGQGSALNNNNSSECRMGYVKHNFTCKSVCDIFPSYCFNGGQCYLVENTGVFCR